MAQVRFYDLQFPESPSMVWSPNTCKTRYALNVKGIPYETVFVSFDGVHSEIPKLTKSDKRPTVPIIIDLAHDNKTVQDSWDIAHYLEKAYPNTPSLFDGHEGVHLFFHNYCTNQLLPPLFKLVVLDVHKRSGSESTQKWFRENREQRFGMTLEEFAGNPEDIIKVLPGLLKPFTDVLSSYPFLTGNKVGWADVMLASALTMVAAIKPEIFESYILTGYEHSSTLRNWWQRMKPYMGDAPPEILSRL
ncbi:hypothetical protein EC973_005920 [Apophysomyces ossiformis]|uniref:GST N-terminal domain-containing protein n=1 Tax=Apophysomyces ossiformis TaxID=679940 RepID=A0A8H7EQR0_9FUNG|nr:hypothetical protein EC973_005920 [Apophysomyces ossiformis]